jgi:hypothetical protein
MPQPTPDTAADYLAQWIMVNEPELFNALLARTPQSVSGFADILSTVVGGVTSAAKNVGSFLASDKGLEALSGLGAVYLQTRMQKDAMKIQIAQAQAGQPPAPIQTATTTSGTTGAFYYPSPASAPVPVTQELVDRFTPAKSMWPWIAGGVVLLFGAALALRR